MSGMILYIGEFEAHSDRIGAINRLIFIREIDINVGLTYVAPQFVMKQIINRWIVEEKIGIGYFQLPGIGKEGG